MLSAWGENGVLAIPITDSQQRAMKLTQPRKYHRAVGILSGERRPISFGTDGGGRGLGESSELDCAVRRLIDVSLRPTGKLGLFAFRECWHDPCP